MVAKTIFTRRETENQLKAAIQPITIPMWLGAERPGVQLGPEALYCGLWNRWKPGGRDYPELLARLERPVSIPVDSFVEAGTYLDEKTFRFEAAIAAACDHLADAVQTAIAGRRLALNLGGDHALAIGSVAGAAAMSDRLGVVWVDAHTDINTTDTSPSGHIHGTPVAVFLGLADGFKELAQFGSMVRPEDMVYLGVRDIDPGERDLLNQLGISTHTMDEWTDMGILAGVDAALEHLTRNGVDAVHVSFDVDVLDPTVMPATGTPVDGGLSFREASQVLRWLNAWDGPICSVDFVELNPALDPSGASTGRAVALLAAFLGETMR